ncbi:MAG TPA: glycosyltransferase family 2 protein [Chryseosolibacter sp.]
MQINLETTGTVALAQKNRIVSFVIPVWNEADNIEKLYAELKTVLPRDRYNYNFIFVDDGSTDRSLEIIKQLSTRDPAVFYIELSRNFGHQYALKAGLDRSAGDAVISMDCDLQHPPEVVLQLITKWEQGFDIVYTTRAEDKNLPWLKRKSSSFFYSLLNWLSDLNLEQGTADFRLMSRNALDAFMQLNESELFIRGLVKWSGFRQIAIEYMPRGRYAGESKYSIKKMLSLALRGITSFSVKPLRLMAYLGMMLFLFSLILIPYPIISYMMGRAVSGWSSLMIVTIFFGSLQMLMLGILGLYISKIAIQSKQRPLYFIRDTNYAVQRREAFEKMP